MSHPSNHPISCSGKKNKNMIFIIHHWHFSSWKSFTYHFNLFDLPRDRNLAPGRFAPSTVDLLHPLVLSPWCKAALSASTKCSRPKSCSASWIWAALAALQKKKSSSGWINHGWFWWEKSKSWHSFMCDVNVDVDGLFFIESNCWRKDIQGTQSKFFRDGKLWINVKKINQ